MDVESEIADMREDIGVIKTKLDNAVILTVSPKLFGVLIAMITGGCLYTGGF